MSGATSLQGGTPLRAGRTCHTAVWKFPLALGPHPVWEEVEMPRYAGIVHVGQQNNVPMLWAVVDPTLPTEMRHLIAIPTGYELAGHHAYVGTAHLHDGAIVVHVFEELPTIPEPALDTTETTT